MRCACLIALCLACGRNGTAQTVPKDDSVTMEEFETIVDIAYWKSIEEKALPLGEKVRQTINKVVKKIA